MARRVVIDGTPLLRQGPPDGIARVTHGLIKAMASVQHEFEIVIFGRRLRGEWLGKLLPGSKTIHLRFPRWRSCEWLVEKARLTEMLCRADLYHATANVMPIGRSARTVVTLHDVLFLVYPEKWLGHDELARRIPAFARRCRAIITASEHSKQDIATHVGVAPERIHVIPWGVDRDLFRPADGAEGVRERLSRDLGLRRPYFVSVSCDIGRKNMPRLLQVYARLADGGAHNDLVLVWANPPPEILDRFCRGPISERIHFLGSQSNEGLRDLYCGATALVYPSIYEGFGLPILEAMSCGTPVVTSNVTSMPEVGGDAAIYVDPLDDDSILRALARFEDEPALAAQLREKGLRQAAKFSWERCARETLGVYRRCLEM